MIPLKPEKQTVNRREWMQNAVCGATFLGLPFMQGSGGQPSTLEATRAMSAMTGRQLDPAWLPSTAELLEIILRSSRRLRALDLGEREPATRFIVR